MLTAATLTIVKFPKPLSNFQCIKPLPDPLFFISLLAFPFSLQRRKHSSIVPLPGNPIYFQTQSYTLPILSSSPYPILFLTYVYLHNQIGQKSIMMRGSYESFIESSLLFGVLFRIMHHR